MKSHDFLSALDALINLPKYFYGNRGNYEDILALKGSRFSCWLIKKIGNKILPFYYWRSIPLDHFSGALVFSRKYVDVNVEMAAIKQFVTIVFTHKGPLYSRRVDDIGAVLFSMNVKSRPMYETNFQWVDIL